MKRILKSLHLLFLIDIYQYKSAIKIKNYYIARDIEQDKSLTL